MRQPIIILLALLTVMPASAKTGRQLIEENGLKPAVKPLLKTEWSQTKGENCLLPMLTDTKQAVTGCGATAMAQLIKFWGVPKHPSGKNFYDWSYGGKSDVFFADFENTSYDWENMIDKYCGNSAATETQKKAVGRLMADIGVALEMQYKLNNEDNPSTGTNIEFIHTALKKYFGYNPNSRILRFINGAYTMDEWRTMIYKELSEGRPILMGGRYGKANHIFVADGYDEEGRVHLNLGKPESSSSYNQNAYYDLTETSATYIEDMRMLLEVCPDTIETELTEAHVGKAGTLKEVLGGETASRRICRLRLSGNINVEDICWLRELSKVTKGQLSYIDLSQCNIENHEIPDSAFKDCYALQEIILPDNIVTIRSKAFYHCLGLYAIHLPKKLQTLKNYVFTRCRYLTSLDFPATLTSIASGPFAYVKLSHLSVDEGNRNFMVENSALLTKDRKTLLAMPMCLFGDYEVADGITKINVHAFNCCDGLRDIILPASVREIGQEAFKSCNRLSDFYCYGSTAPSLASNVFLSSPNLNILHVPEECRQEYLDKGWTMFKEIVEDLPLPMEGDVNRDGAVDISDIVAVINTIAGDNTNLPRSDVNQDGKTDISDIVSIINLIAGE